MGLLYRNTRTAASDTEQDCWISRFFLARSQQCLVLPTTREPHSSSPSLTGLRQEEKNCQSSEHTAVRAPPPPETVHEQHEAATTQGSRDTSKAHVHATKRASKRQAPQGAVSGCVPQGARSPVLHLKCSAGEEEAGEGRRQAQPQEIAGVTKSELSGSTNAVGRAVQTQLH